MKSLTEFFELVQAAAIAEGCTASFKFGREHLIRRDFQGAGTANRIVMAPGAPDGVRGTFGAPTKAHVLERPDVMRHERLVTVQIWGYDSAARNDQMAQDDALEGLLQCFLRSARIVVLSQGHRLHNLYQAKQTFPIAPSNRRHGDMCQLVFWVAFNVRDVAPTAVVDDATVEPVVQKSIMPSGEIAEEV